jgi:glycosyltransferase involved in cell wall biosynthesis
LPLNIIQIAPSGGAHGGIEALSVSIAKAVGAAGYDIETAFRLRVPEVRDSFRTAVLESGIRVSVFRRPNIRLLASIARADVVHCHYPIWWVVLLAHLFRKPVVLTVENQKQTKHPLMMRIDAMALNAAMLPVFISRFVARTWLGEKRETDAVVIPAITDFVSRIVSPRERRGFVNIGRWVPGKGVLELVVAYSKANIDHAEHPLVLIGEGELEPEVRKAVQAAGDSIRLAGYVTDDEKIKMLSSSRWNIAPQTIAEDQGMTPLEARICGVPSIVSNIGGLPEAAGPGALLSEPGDSLSLTQKIQEAVELSESDYVARCEANSKELESYVVPLSYYCKLYERVVDERK